MSIPLAALVAFSASSASPYSSASSLVNAAGAQFVNRNCVAALAVLVYDILLTTDEEVQFIWPKRLSYTKILYFFIRYFPVLVLTSILFVGTELTPQFHFTPHDCFIWQVWQGVGALLVAAAVDIVLVLRVYAMYAQSRVILIVLAAAFILEMVGMITSLGMTLPGIQYDEICAVSSVPSTVLLYGASAILFQLLLFVLTAAKFVRSLRSGWRSTPLVSLLARDGTWAFGLIFFIMVLQASLYAIPGDVQGSVGVFYGWLLAVSGFCGYRTLLNIQHLSPSLGGTRARARHTRVPSSPGGAADATVAFTTHIAYDSAVSDEGEGVSSSSALGDAYEMPSLTGSSRMLHREP